MKSVKVIFFPFLIFKENHYPARNMQCTIINERQPGFVLKKLTSSNLSQLFNIFFYPQDLNQKAIFLFQALRYHSFITTQNIFAVIRKTGLWAGTYI